jgi:hypothetical protein
MENADNQNNGTSIHYEDMKKDPNYYGPLVLGKLESCISEKQQLKEHYEKMLVSTREHEVEKCRLEKVPIEEKLKGYTDKEDSKKSQTKTNKRTILVLSGVLLLLVAVLIFSIPTSRWTQLLKILIFSAGLGLAFFINTVEEWGKNLKLILGGIALITLYAAGTVTDADGKLYIAKLMGLEEKKTETTVEQGGSVKDSTAVKK